MTFNAPSMGFRAKAVTDSPISGRVTLTIVSATVCYVLRLKECEKSFHTFYARAPKKAYDLAGTEARSTSRVRQER